MPDIVVVIQVLGVFESITYIIWHILDVTCTLGIKTNLTVVFWLLAFERELL